MLKRYIAFLWESYADNNHGGWENVVRVDGEPLTTDSMEEMHQRLHEVFVRWGTSVVTGHIVDLTTSQIVEHLFN